jgi:hypothetical protein
MRELRSICGEKTLTDTPQPRGYLSTLARVSVDQAHSFGEMPHEFMVS